MPSELLIAAGPGEWRAALLEDGIPAELIVERGDRNEAGSVTSAGSSAAAGARRDARRYRQRSTSVPTTVRCSRVADGSMRVSA
jgi:hypothetical protein